MRHLVLEEGLEEHFEIDSAGTAGWHIGNPPDSRMTAAARARGIPMTGRARQVSPSDFESFDHIFAMDHSNHKDLLTVQRKCSNPRATLHLFCTWCEDHEEEEVPDPYYGGPEGFEKVLDLLEDGCAAFLREWKKENPS